MNPSQRSPMLGERPLWLTFTLVAALLLFAACKPIQPEGSTVPAVASSTTGEEMTIWIGPQTQTCMGVTEMQCMQVRWEEDGEWQNFFGGIDGFVFVPGYNYELTVQATPVANPPADGSSIAYSLVSVDSRTPDYAGDPMPLVGTNWQLIHFGDEATVPFDPTRIDVTAVFGEDGSVYGSAGCNSYFGTYALEGDTLIAISELGSTRMMCPDEQMVVENAFLQAFPGHHEYKINGDKLEMIWAAGQMIFQGSAAE